MAKKKDRYKELACEFVNEADCEEEADEEGVEFEDIEKEHYDRE